MPTILVIADDLTGANDAGAKCARAGISSCVILSSEQLRFSIDTTVLIVNTNSRHISAQEARDRISKLVLQAKKARIPYIYKKTDSTLRGNIGAELSALLSHFSDLFLPFVPSFPQANRITRGGKLYVNGIPVSETAFGKDPQSPLTTSVVSDIINSQDSQIAFLVQDRKNPDKGIGIFDAETREEIADIAETLHARNADHIAAGPVGFFEALLQVWQLPKKDFPVPTPPSPFLFINGSINPVSLNQIKKGAEIVSQAIQISPDQHLHKTSWHNSMVRLKTAYSTLLFTAESTNDIESYWAAYSNDGTSADDFHSALTVDFAHRASEFIGHYPDYKTICIFGGETSYAVLRALHIYALYPLQEIEEGVCMSAPPSGCAFPCVITKSGGFGGEDIIQKILA